MKTEANIFKALSDETRLEIMVLLLWHKELCGCDVEAVLDISQSRSSRHLRYLLNAGLVENRRQGPWMHYRIPKNLPKQTKSIVDTLHRMFKPDNQLGLKRRFDKWIKEKNINQDSCSSRQAFFKSKQGYR